MTKKIIVIIIGILLVAPAVFAKDDASIQVKGSDTMVNLSQAWAEEFMKKNPEVFIAITGGGSGTGIAALINGTCDMANSSRQIKDKERALAEKKGVHAVEFKPAIDGIAVVAHPKNPVSQLTMDELAGIFAGKIRNWKEVGGKDEKIVVLSREVNSGTHVYFKEHVLAGTGEFSPEALLLPSSQAIADEVSQNEAAIGYYGMGYLSSAQKAVPLAKDEHSPAVAPTTDRVIAGDYPISRPLYVYTKGEPQGAVKAFMDFIFSKEGQEIVSKTDFVPVAA
ncbi:MAG: PstS family phosphate ABC transporter substrate-binding protein [Candidatus Omnitrophica bacterium]|nr:PstS family phosphate ABC transporter substrate-binding protein [Candidatus Omnitrophota bacterium]